MGLLKLLKSDANARKIFGERELKIIEKQLLGINLTQSEKNRLSRDIRKKLSFIERVSNFSDEFRIQKGSEIKKIIKDAKEASLDDKLFQKIKKIVLFGSAAENKLTFRSDIDLAVVFDDIKQEEAFLFRKRVLGNCPNNVDIQVYNVLPEKIKNEIEKKGRVIYEK